MRLCDRHCWILGLERHKAGFVGTGSTIHWRPRGMSRRGLWNFLKLVARSKIGSEHMRVVERVWLEDTMAYDLALAELGVRFPRWFADTDRAQVRAALATLEPWQIDEPTRSKITRWAQDETP